MNYEEMSEGKLYKLKKGTRNKCDGCAFDGDWDGCQFDEDREPACSSELIYIKVKEV